jgi:hypothetical protein
MSDQGQRSLAQHSDDLFTRDPLAAVLFGIVGGSLPFLIGLAVACDWRGSAHRYTSWIQLFLPPAPRLSGEDRLTRDTVRNRTIFGVIAAFGLLLVAGGIVGVLRGS